MSVLIVETILSLGPFVLGGASLLALTEIVVASEAGIFFIGWVYLRIWFNEPVTLSVPPKQQIRWILASGLVMIVIGISITVISAKSGIKIGRVDQQLLMRSQATVLVLAVLSFVVIAPAEEFLFRGVIQRRLARSMPTPIAIFVTALFFIIPHAIGYLGNVQGILLLSIAPFSLAVITGLLYEKFDNLAVPILCHGFYNATLFMMAYFIAF